MTDNDIIKALECCCNAVECDDNCPLKHKPSITDCNKEFLDLINRQKAEIERLQKDSKRLKKVQMQLDDAMKMYSTIKAEAVREFAERLKNKRLHIEDEGQIFKMVHCYEIDNLVKEMVGENK